MAIVKKITSRKRPHINVTKQVDPLKMTEEKLMRYIENEIAELILLRGISEPAAVSVYSMSYEEYMELPGNVRL